MRSIPCKVLWKYRGVATEQSVSLSWRLFLSFPFGAVVMGQAEQLTLGGSILPHDIPKTVLARLESKKDERVEL